MSTDRKQQHYVWAYHLRAWEVGGRLWCHWRSQRKLGKTQATSIAKQRYYYQMHELTAEDIAVVEGMIRKSDSPELQELNRRWIDSGQETFRLRRLIADADLPDAKRGEALAHLAQHARNGVEPFHTSLEEAFLPTLDGLRQGDTSFYASPLQRQVFIRFIAFQYFRTRNMGSRLTAAGLPFTGRIPNHDPERTRLYETLIVSTNLGRSLVAQGDRYGVAILDNETAAPFITGDQPVINRLSVEEQNVLLYFPLSPIRALLYGPTDLVGQSRSVGSLEAETLNHLMFRAAADQAYSHDEAYLRDLVALGCLPT